MPSLLLIPLSVVGGLAGAVLHELTHYGIARVMNREAHLDLIGMDTYFETGEDDTAIRIGPTLLGSWVFFVCFGLQVSVPVWFAWGVYTLGGVPNDFTGLKVESH